MKSNKTLNLRSSILFLYLSTAMALVIALSNWLVTFAVNDWITLGAFSYPLSFLITDLTNKRFGSKKAKIVVFIGFGVGVILTALFNAPRIALASGFAFLTAQLTDINIFNRIKKWRIWWIPPLISSIIASVIDTFLFFSIAFVATGLPWVTWSLGDLVIKMIVAFLALAPYRIFSKRLAKS